MDIQKTITKEIAQDVSSLLQNYLNRVDNSFRIKFLSTASKILKGEALSSPQKANIAKVGASAVAVLGMMTSVAGLGDALLKGLEPYVAGRSYEAQAAIMGVGLATMATGMAIDCYAKSLRDKLISSERLPEEVSELLNRKDISEILKDPTKMIKALKTIPKESFEHLKQNAWIVTNREAIQSGDIPIKQQYDVPKINSEKIKLSM